MNPFHSLTHHPGLTQAQHRALTGISNTDLGRIADEALGRPQRNLKVRPDLIIDSPKRTRRTLIDFKTTSCATHDQFLATVEAYDYDRQGAFYADVLGAQRVVLLAVQKRPRKDAPPAVWRVELTSGQLATGRKKYGRLLREITRTAG